MVDVTVAPDQVTFEVLGLHKLWTLKSRLTVRLEHITSVRADPGVSLGWGAEIRWPGTYIPGMIKAGTFYGRGRKTFWDVAHRERAIVVELANDRYDALIVEVADPPAAVARIEQARRSAP